MFDIFGFPFTLQFHDEAALNLSADYADYTDGARAGHGDALATGLCSCLLQKLSRSGQAEAVLPTLVRAGKGKAEIEKAQKTSAMLTGPLNRCFWL